VTPTTHKTRSRTEEKESGNSDKAFPCSSRIAERVMHHRPFFSPCSERSKQPEMYLERPVTCSTPLVIRPGVAPSHRAPPTDQLRAPGPNGLPGGYPVQGGKQSLEVVLPQGLTLEEAIHINQEGQRLDGIERIDDDGTVYFAERNMAIW
jgi:hypothetical protein